MSELRQDRLTRRWVMMAEARGQRPMQFSAPSTAELADCPFCAGNEHLTPAEILALPSTDAWQVRIVPNKYPAVRRPLAAAYGPSSCRDAEFASAERTACDAIGQEELSADEPYGRRDDYGVHDVVVESREHLTEFADASPAVAAWTFQAFRARILDLARDPRLRHVQVFKNNGAASGASIGHVHSQILATEVVPHDVLDEWRAARDWAERRNECLVCRLLADELADARRIVADTERYVAFCPYASRHPFEMRIVPRRHAARYETSDDDELRELAELVLDLVRRLRRELGDVAYNLALRCAPLGQDGLAAHWRWEILPRTTMFGGYELSAGILINTVQPEEAARRLARA